MFDAAAHDVWGVQPYRGATFGDLFRAYVSAKPLLVSEYGMDAYQDVPRTGGGLATDARNREHGAAYQGRVVPRLAAAIEAEDSRRSDVWFAATTLLRGDAPDSGGGYAVLEYNARTRHLAYTLVHRTFTDGSIRFVIPGLVDAGYSRRWLSHALELDPGAGANVSTTSDAAECRVASGLALCARWNGRRIGTCYAVRDIDALAHALVRAFGGSQCAVEWACASLATCYFSSNPRHWCAHADRALCEAAFDDCGTLPCHSPIAFGFLRCFFPSLFCILLHALLFLTYKVCFAQFKRQPRFHFAFLYFLVIRWTYSFFPCAVSNM